MICNFSCEFTSRPNGINLKYNNTGSVHMCQTLNYYSLTYSQLFFLTWLQFNTGQSNIQNDDDAGNDLNVEPAWIQGYTGCNSIVGVVDDGKKKIHL